MAVKSGQDELKSSINSKCFPNTEEIIWKKDISYLIITFISIIYWDIIFIYWVKYITETLTGQYLVTPVEDAQEGWNGWGTEKEGNKRDISMEGHFMGLERNLMPAKLPWIHKDEPN